MGIDEYFYVEKDPNLSDLPVYKHSTRTLDLGRKVYQENIKAFERDHNKEYVCIELSHPEEPKFYFSDSLYELRKLIKRESLLDCYINGINLEMPELEIS
tara:strand:- start:7195 stop:7494 length:300 start_codon:yes stop_codon:yes gene_type:complete